MTFKEKIDKILSVNRLKIDSVSALEDAIGSGRGAVNDFYKVDRDPGRKTIKNIKSLEGLNGEWWETGKGDVFIKKSSGQESISEVSEKNTEEIYRNLVESNSDYRLVPKTILDEEYRIVLKSELDEKAQMWRDTLNAKNALIDQLHKEITELRERPVLHSKNA